MTTTSLANCRAFNTTDPIVAPSLYAGIAAMILDSEESFRRTAGTEADTCLSISPSLRSRWASRACRVGPERAGLPISVLAEFPVIETVTLPALDRTPDRGSIKAPDRRVPASRPEDA